jgi:DNA-binding SARP family transcriptional activator
LEIADAAGPVTLAEGRQRSVLIYLLLHHDETVASERLIDALWREAPPATAAKVLQNQISQLRRALDDREGERLQTRGRGYALTLASDELDLDRFEQLATAGSEALERGQPAEAAERLRAALALWRGPPLADVAYESFAQAEIARLEERRLVVLEQRIDADLALGRHAQLTAELEARVAQEPVRERLRAQLMLALYRSGRQTDALASFQEARHLLLEEHGMEPGPELRDLQEAILRQDPELAAAPSRWPSRYDRPRRVTALLAIGGALLVAAATAAVVSEEDDGAADRAHVILDLSDNSIAAVDPASGQVELGLPLAGRPVSLSAVKDTALIATVDPNALVMADAVTNSLTKNVALDVEPGAIATCGDDVWVAAGARGALYRSRRGYAPEGPPLTWARSGRGSTGVACSARAVWVADGSHLLWRFDPEAGDATPLDVGVRLTAVTAGAGGVAAVSSRPATVVLVDEASNDLTSIQFAARGGGAGPAPTGVAMTAEAVWVLNANTGNVSVINLEQGALTDTVAIGIDHAPRSIVAAGETVWVANSDGTLTRIDAADGTTTTVEVGQALAGVAVARSRVWLTTRALDNQRPGGDG